MATITTSWAAENQIFGTSDGYSSSLSTTEAFTSGIDCTGNDLVHLHGDVNFQTTPSDNIVVNVYGSRDNTDWSTIPLLTFEIDNAYDTDFFDIMVADPPPYIRVGAVQTASSDTTNAIRMYERKRSWSSA